jgi:hypothetical protein
MRRCAPSWWRVSWSSCSSWGDVCVCAGTCGLHGLATHSRHTQADAASASVTKQPAPPPAAPASLSSESLPAPAASSSTNAAHAQALAGAAAACAARCAGGIACVTPVLAEPCGSHVSACRCCCC